MGVARLIERTDEEDSESGERFSHSTLRQWRGRFEDGHRLVPELEVVELPVESPSAIQGVMVSPLDDRAVVQDDDFVGMAHRGEPVGNDQHRPILHEMVDGLLHQALGRRVESSIVLRDLLENGSTVDGPAAITENETTIVLPSSRQAVRQPDGCIDVVQQV